MSETGSLPPNWECVRLGGISDIVYGKGLPTNKLEADGYPVFGASGVIGFFSQYMFEEPQLMISCRGAKSGTINFSPAKCFVTNNSLVVDFPIEQKSLRKTYFYFLQAADKGGMVTGTAQPQVTINNAVEVELPLPPLNEQHRIVAKIEELFSELEKGVESLKAAKAQLAVYRQSVLKAAFEGRLTEGWREENQNELESATELLARIKSERESRHAAQLAEWQQSVADWEASGGKASGSKKPTKPKPPKELPPLTADELADLPTLPDGWGWFRFGNTYWESILGKMLDKQKNKGELFPYLRNQNVRWGAFDLTDVSLMRFEADEYARYGLETGDLVICEGGEPGRCAIWQGNKSEMRVQKALHRVRFLPETILGNFVRYFIQFSATSGHLSRFFTGTTIKHLTGNGLQDMHLPACGFAEQHQIVQEIESRFSVVEKMEQTIEESLQKAEALRQSILKRAFEGKLVPQDPSDEPAAELLARIRAEREAAAPVRKKGKAA
ncbi:MAG: restriction endonuclease subunit S [Zetaproteobacteria bacterium]|nr:restriction endonuclease subunit S [Zetaproteobacteria bacterium]